MPSSTASILFASHNADKIAEARAMLGAVGISIVSGAELGLDEPLEDGATFEENAAIKARAAFRATGMPVVADDTGLCVDALRGRPGIHTADWAGSPRNYGRAMTRVVDELQDAGALDEEDRSARFVCVLCVIAPDGETRFFRGEVPGTIVWPPRGGGPGYDPIFRPVGWEKHDRLAETVGWDPTTAPARTHRGGAFATMIADPWFRKLISPLP